MITPFNGTFWAWVETPNGWAISDPLNDEIIVARETEFYDASPVGEEAERLSLLQCVPHKTELPGIGYRGAVPHVYYTYGD